MELTKEELLKLATLSALTIQEEEIPHLLKQIKDVLSYAKSIKQLADQEDILQLSLTQEHHLREDRPREWDRQEILEQAPEHTQDFFVVPRILEGQ